MTTTTQIPDLADLIVTAFDLARGMRLAAEDKRLNDWADAATGRRLMAIISATTCEKTGPRQVTVRCACRALSDAPHLDACAAEMLDQASDLADRYGIAQQGMIDHTGQGTYTLTW